jgi:perosamine synthetase
MKSFHSKNKLNKSPSVKSLLIQKNFTISKAMKIIENGGQRVGFVVDKFKLLNILTDGDIRRALLKKNNLNTKISEIIRNKKFKFLHINSSFRKIQKEMSGQITHMPLVDDKNNLIDYATNFKFNKIPIAEPQFQGNEILYLNDCIKSGWVSSKGKYITKFENTFSEFIKTKNSLSVTSGTTALHLALASLGIKKGDEVIVPNLTFIAPINAIIYLGAKPVLVDVDKNNLCMSVEKFEKAITKKTKAVILVYLYGHACEIQKLNKTIKRKKLLLIEDCAEAVGTIYKKKQVGNFGDASTWSFFGNKTITTGEGGMICFKKKKHLDFAKKLRDHGMNLKKRYWHDSVGYNYRMTNLQAAVGLAQMERLNYFIKQKRNIAKKYNSYLKKNKKLIFTKNLPDTKSSYWLYYIKLKKNIVKFRDNIIKDLLKNGIEARNCFYPVNQMSPYKKYNNKKNNLENSINLSKSIITLPSSVNLGDKDIKSITDNLNFILERYK